MKHVLVVYESVYGNTERLASIIADEISQFDEIECDVKKPDEIHTEALADYDAIIFGCPNHNQAPARNILKFIERASIVDLEEKVGSVFDTYTGGNKGIAASKLEKYISEKIPCIKIIMKGFSAKVNGRKGPLAEEEIDRAREFGRAFVEKILI